MLPFFLALCTAAAEASCRYRRHCTIYDLTKKCLIDARVGLGTFVTLKGACGKTTTTTEVEGDEILKSFLL